MITTRVRAGAWDHPAQGIVRHSTVWLHTRPLITPFPPSVLVALHGCLQLYVPRGSVIIPVSPSVRGGIQLGILSLDKLSQIGRPI